MITMFGPPDEFDGCCEGVFLSPRVTIEPHVHVVVHVVAVDGVAQRAVDAFAV